MIYHIDMAYHYDQRTFSVVALVSVNANNHRDNLIKKGIIIIDPLRKELLKEYDKMKLHAGVISLLLDNIEIIKKVIICPDITPVDKVIGLISEIHPNLVLGVFKPLTELREEIGDKNYRSEADAFARNIRRNFRKKKNVHRTKRYFSTDNIKIISSKNSEDYKTLLERLNALKEK